MKLKKWLYCFIFIMCALLFIPLGFALHYQPIYHRQPVFEHYYGTTTCYVFTLLCIFLVIALVLFWILQKRSFSQVLRQESKMLKWFFVVFFIAYFLRTAYLWILGDWRYTKAFNTIFSRYLMIDLLPMIWDIVPISAILIIHVKEFSKRPIRKD